MTEHSMDVPEQLRKSSMEDGPDLLREILATMAQLLMSADADALCGGAYGTRSPERKNRRNGYRNRNWDTRLGPIDLAIPRLREGTYYPDWLLEPRRRSEKALVAVIAEAYVNGVRPARSSAWPGAWGSRASPNPRPRKWLGASTRP